MVTAWGVLGITALASLLLMMAIWFSWVVLGARKLYYKMFQRKKINKILDLLYENENNQLFKHERVEKYIQLGFYNPVLFEMAEKIYYKQRQRTNKLNTKEIKYGTIRKAPKPSREIESFKVPYEDAEEYPTEEHHLPAPTRAGNGATRRNGYNEARGVPPATRRVEPRTTPSYPARVGTNSQVAGQRDLQVRRTEKPLKKSRYFD
jgi:hypothetical protein